MSERVCVCVCMCVRARACVRASAQRSRDLRRTTLPSTDCNNKDLYIYIYLFIYLINLFIYVIIYLLAAGIASCMNDLVWKRKKYRQMLDTNQLKVLTKIFAKT